MWGILWGSRAHRLKICFLFNWVGCVVRYKPSHHHKSVVFCRRLSWSLMPAFDLLRTFAVYYLAAPWCYAIATSEIWWQDPFPHLKTVIPMRTAASIRGFRWRYRRSFRPTESVMRSTFSTCLPVAQSWIARQICPLERQWYWTAERSAVQRWSGGKAPGSWVFASTASWMCGRLLPWSNDRKPSRPGWRHVNSLTSRGIS